MKLPALKTLTGDTHTQVRLFLSNSGMLVLQRTKRGCWQYSALQTFRNSSLGSSATVPPLLACRRLLFPGYTCRIHSPSTTRCPTGPISNAIAACTLHMASKLFTFTFTFTWQLSRHPNPPRHQCESYHHWQTRPTHHRVRHTCCPPASRPFCPRSH